MLPSWGQHGIVHPGFGVVLFLVLASLSGKFLTTQLLLGSFHLNEQNMRPLKKDTPPFASERPVRGYSFGVAEGGVQHVIVFFCSGVGGGGYLKTHPNGCSFQPAKDEQQFLQMACNPARRVAWVAAGKRKRSTCPWGLPKFNCTSLLLVRSAPKPSSLSL